MNAAVRDAAPDARIEKLSVAQQAALVPALVDIAAEDGFRADDLIAVESYALRMKPKAADFLRQALERKHTEHDAAEKKIGAALQAINGALDLYVAYPPRKYGGSGMAYDVEVEFPRAHAQFNAALSRALPLVDDALAGPMDRSQRARLDSALSQLPSEVHRVWGGTSYEDAGQLERVKRDRAALSGP
jgi:hypothetical protein